MIENMIINTVKNRPLITVIMPCYNAELIVIDEGSSYGFSDIILNLSELQHA